VRRLFAIPLFLALALCAGSLWAGGYTPSPSSRPIGPPDPLIEPPFPPRAECTAVPRATNLLCNPDFDRVGPLGATTSRTITAGGGAGDSAARIWWLFVHGSGTIQTELRKSDRPGAKAPRGETPMMLWVSTGSGASGVLQQFLGLKHGPQHVSYRIWIKVVSGGVTVSFGDGGKHKFATKLLPSGRWELLEGCSAFDPADPIALNQVYIASPNRAPAEFYLDFVEVKSADQSFTERGCIDLSEPSGGLRGGSR
jgi:hypothetical protein